MIKLGIDRIEEAGYCRLFRGKRIGLVASSSGISVKYGYLGTIDVMNRIYRIEALFAPEHGSRGVLAPGEQVMSGVDELTGIPSYSLFEDFAFTSDSEKAEKAYMPAEHSLENIDVMVFDMQDVGSRYFTYASTLFYTMKACAAKKLPLVVLDRPNPLGGNTVEGGRQQDNCCSFIGLAKVPIRHAMTICELAEYYNGEYKLGCDLTVVPMQGWTRDMIFCDCGLPFVKPSPNLPTKESVYVYNGTCMFAGTNLSEGRGTTTPFTTVGAPYIHPIRLADALNQKQIPGVAFSPAFFMPYFSKYTGVVCRGVNIHITNPKDLKAVYLGLEMLRTVQNMYPTDFKFNPPKDVDSRWHIDLSTGNADVRTTEKSAEELFSEWTSDGIRFAEETRRYRLYK